jgi:hypothetical protein
MNLQASNFRAVLKSQYHAALDMLRQAVILCPDDLWSGGEHPNAYWHVAYHALFITHMYLQKGFETFRPWEHHRDTYQFLGPVPGNPQLGPKIEDPFSQAQVLEYLVLCEAEIDGAVDRLDLAAQESGFPWYKMSKLEHQLVNLRHLQHHTAQLADRLRRSAGQGVGWVGGKPSAP